VSGKDNIVEDNEQTKEKERQLEAEEQQAADAFAGAAGDTVEQADAGDTVVTDVDAGAARIAELEQIAEEKEQRFLRAQADFDNFRRRTVKEKEELAGYASMKLLGQLLPVVDNFERAIAAVQGGGDFESLSKGVDMIFRQMEQLLEQEGLKPMNAVGQPFNPEYHQAIMQVESEEHEEGIVVEEIQKGYMLKDKVLRPAMVKVSS
jgi:molecular chaperone GrpE